MYLGKKKEGQVSVDDFSLRRQMLSIFVGHRPQEHASSVIAAHRAFPLLRYGVA